MRTTITNHELLPEGLRLEGLSIETGRVSICVASGASRSRSRGIPHPARPLS